MHSRGGNAIAKVILFFDFANLLYFSEIAVAYCLWYAAPPRSERHLGRHYISFMKNASSTSSNTSFGLMLSNSCMQVLSFSTSMELPMME